MGFDQAASLLWTQSAIYEMRGLDSSFFRVPSNSDMLGFFCYHLFFINSEHVAGIFPNMRPSLSPLLSFPQTPVMNYVGLFLFKTLEKNAVLEGLFHIIHLKENHVKGLVLFQQLKQ